MRLALAASLLVGAATGCSSSSPTDTTGLDATTGDHATGAQDGSVAPTDGAVTRLDGADGSNLTGKDAASDVNGDAGVADAADGGGCAILPANSLAVKFANSVLARWPNPESLSGTTPAWEYNAGIVLHGLEEVYRRTSNASYLAYIKEYVDDFVDAAGTVNMPMGVTNFSFDNIQPSLLLPFLWQETGEAKYQIAAQNIRTIFNTIPTNPAGGFWHKYAYPNQMWLDGIYMGEPFLARYGAVFNCADGDGGSASFCFDTPTFQMSLLATHAQTAPIAGLLYHAWDDISTSEPTAAWANSTTGLSSEVWGRGQGWYAMALVDVLGYMPESYSGRATLLTILQNLAAGLKAAQDPTTGLWYEVVDMAACTGNWLETSGSGMYVYALRVAVDRGYIDSSYMSVVNAGWTGLQTQVTTDTVGPVINNAVEGLDPQASCAGYIDATKLSDSSQGECAILLAASVMEATCP
jgi:unsaturated rhamnogalacturonyl hydrolase